MHKKASHYLIAFALIASALIGYFFFSGDDSVSLPTQEDCPEPCEKDTKANKLLSPRATTQNTRQSIVEELSSMGSEQQPQRKKLPASEWNAKYQAPGPLEDGFLDTVVKLADSHKTDPTGLASFRLWSALATCRYAPSSDEELESQIRETEQLTLTEGLSNGNVMLRINVLKKLYAACSEASEVVPVANAYHLLEKAAKKGLPRAKAFLAVTPPPGYETWSEEKKGQHVIEAGKLLAEARAACEPKAFEIYSWANNSHTQALWTPPDPPPSENPKVQEYTNLLALGLIYANNYEGATPESLKGYFDQFQQLSKSMYPYEVEQAEKHGQALYKKYCQ